MRVPLQRRPSRTRRRLNFFPCYPAANIFAKMSQPVPIPATATNIKLSFFWLAGGGTDAYGEVYYSTNGTTWTQLTSRSGSQQLRNNANSWYADTISLPASVAGQNLYIGLRFINQESSGEWSWRPIHRGG
jgi:hypothetical protein